MEIHGLQKMTLLDWPGKVACTVFLGGCDFRCPFCQNSGLITGPTSETIPKDEFFAFLSKRRRLLASRIQSRLIPLPEILTGAKQKTINFYLKWLRSLERRIFLITSTVIWSPQIYAVCAAGCGLISENYERNQAVSLVRENLRAVCGCSNN